jgi:NAD(P)-dependent dehydrogenase (short-subunit alcohol dehydrogenase family)
MPGALEGKVALVTGAGQGLGREVALRFAAEGATVVLAARSADKLEGVAREVGQAGGRAIPIATDVSDQQEVAELHDRVSGELGPLDVLVNNSGIAGPTAPLWKQTRAAWDETFAVNVTGVFLMCRAFLPEMIERNLGSVVIVGSMTGKRPLAGRTPYAASKTALIGLLRTLVWDLGESGVRANLISPGPIAGPRLDGVIADRAAASALPEADIRRELASVSPQTRFVDAAEIAAAALYLASDAASAITGEDLNVSAGAVTYS